MWIRCKNNWKKIVDYVIREKREKVVENCWLSKCKDKKIYMRKYKRIIEYIIRKKGKQIEKIMDYVIERGEKQLKISCWYHWKGKKNTRVIDIFYNWPT